jgi:hypothetical protein
VGRVRDASREHGSSDSNRWAMEFTQPSNCLRQHRFAPKSTTPCRRIVRLPLRDCASSTAPLRTLRNAGGPPMDMVRKL